jgi:hypothetical protein
MDLLSANFLQTHIYAQTQIEEDDEEILLVLLRNVISRLLRFVVLLLFNYV